MHFRPLSLFSACFFLLVYPLLFVSTEAVIAQMQIIQGLSFLAKRKDAGSNIFDCFVSDCKIIFSQNSEVFFFSSSIILLLKMP